DLVADARLGAALRADELHVRRMQGRFALDDAALDVLARVRPRVALDHVHALHDQPVVLGLHFQDAAALAAVLARDDEHVVVFPNWSSQTRHKELSHRLHFYKTSGANEIIFMNFRSRSSR